MIFIIKINGKITSKKALLNEAKPSSKSVSGILYNESFVITDRLEKGGFVQKRDKSFKGFCEQTFLLSTLNNASLFAQHFETKEYVNVKINNYFNLISSEDLCKKMINFSVYNIDPLENTKIT
jgi:hypothetical protein